MQNEVEVVALLAVHPQTHNIIRYIKAMLSTKSYLEQNMLEKNNSNNKVVRSNRNHAPNLPFTKIL